jgi:hypothetical protein
LTKQQFEGLHGLKGEKGRTVSLSKDMTAGYEYTCNKDDSQCTQDVDV